jgi:TIR domain/Domain of unknown function (DUF4062)
MGYVPGYENDVFISYAHVDNVPIVPGKPGWVDFFEDLLRKRVKARLRGEIQFFRDQQLRLYRKFSDQLFEKLAGSAILICIPSPNYVESDWCLWELEQFYKRTGSDRIIKVVKTHFDEQSLKPRAKLLLKQLEHVLDSRFYARNESTGFIEDLLPEVNPEHILASLQKIEVIAQNLVELFKKLSAAPKPFPSSATSATTQPAERDAEAPDAPQPSVYLAEPAKGLETEYNSVKSELLQFNYRVLPDQPLPLDAEELTNTVSRHLQEARLFVHLIGARYGVRPDGDDRSIPHIQYELAAELDRRRQVVWLKPDQTPENQNQRDFIDLIKNHSPNYWQTKLADLKAAIQKKLQPPAASGWEVDEKRDSVNVCLYYHEHEEDMKSIRRLYSHLMVNEAFKVKRPLQEAPSLQAHKQLLQASDAVLLYYGASDEEWFVNIWKQIRRHLSTERNKPLLAQAIYAGHPPSIEKDLLESDDPMIIRNYGSFTPSALAPFIERIRAAKGGA